jgi:hypothetical protein
MPTWIWLFWTQQILQLFFSQSNQLENLFSRVILDKISKLYPQSIYYQLKGRQELQRSGPQ